ARLVPATSTVAAKAATAAAKRRLRTRFVDHQAASAELRLVQLGDRARGLFARAHFDERKPAGSSRGGVTHDVDRLDLTRPREQLLELRFTDFVRKIANIQLTTHGFDSSEIRT